MKFKLFGNYYRVCYRFTRNELQKNLIADFEHAHPTFDFMLLQEGKYPVRCELFTLTFLMTREHGWFAPKLEMSLKDDRTHKIIKRILLLMEPFIFSDYHNVRNLVGFFKKHKIERVVYDSKMHYFIPYKVNPEKYWEKKGVTQ